MAVTTLGWGLNWPLMKMLLHHWPPLSARGWAGLVGALVLAAIARLRGERLAVPRHAIGPLMLAALFNVTAWMGIGTLAMASLSVAEAAMLGAMMIDNRLADDLLQHRQQLLGIIKARFTRQQRRQVVDRHHVERRVVGHPHGGRDPVRDPVIDRHRVVGPVGVAGHVADHRQPPSGGHGACGDEDRRAGLGQDRVDEQVMGQNLGVRAAMGGLSYAAGGHG